MAKLTKNQKLTKMEKLNMMLEVHKLHKDNQEARFAIGSVFIHDYLFGASIEDLEEVLENTKELLKVRLKQARKRA